MRNWQLHEHESWSNLQLDCADSRSNTLSKAVLQELDDCLQQLEQHPPQALLITSGKRSGFILGANIHAFTSLRDSSEALDMMQQAQHVFSRLAALPCRTLAWIDGYCLGGGLELALACDIRLSSETARFAFPEVRLGIHPGFGGTVRATQLIGGWKALPIMLSGRELSAKQAAKLGLVHAVLPARHRQRAIAQWLHADVPASTGQWSNHRLLRPAITALMRWKTQKKVNPRHYPAPFQLLSLWQQWGDNPQRMYIEEAQSVSQLITATTAQALIRCFLLRQQLKTIAKQQRATTVNHVHVIGAGRMGGDIAAWCALQGLRVSLQDTTLEAIAHALQRANQLFHRQCPDSTTRQAAKDRLWPDTHGHGISSADVIIEAVFEDVDIKRDVLQQAEQQARPDALLATNTSSIPLQRLAQSLAQPERLIGLHFFNPVAKMPLIEVVHWHGSSDSTQQQACALAAQLGKLPLPVDSQPGFLVNRLLMPYLLQAMTMNEEGTHATHIDRVACAWGMPVGPLMLADQVGLDICLHVACTLAVDHETMIPKVLRQHVADGNLGKKTGHGFYQHHQRRPAWPRKPQLLNDLEIQDRLVFSILNEAVACLHDEVVTSAELCDAGMIFGAGFAPFHGGPMALIQSLGVTHCQQRLSELEQRYGSAFQAHSSWPNASQWLHDG